MLNSKHEKKYTHHFESSDDEKSREKIIKYVCTLGKIQPYYYCLCTHFSTGNQKEQEKEGKKEFKEQQLNILFQKIIISRRCVKKGKRKKNIKSKQS